MGNDPKTAEKANQRAGWPNVGEAKTDDDVQRAVDMGDGKYDGDIEKEPESDVQAAIHLYNEGPQDAEAKLDLFIKAAKAVCTKGERHIDSEDWGPLALILGPALYSLIKVVVALVK